MRDDTSTSNADLNNLPDHERDQPAERRSGSRKPLPNNKSKDGPDVAQAYEPRFAKVARIIWSLGGSDFEVGLALGVEEITIDKWKYEYADFRNACRLGCDLADGAVERSLYQRACGYSYWDVKIFHWRGRIIRAPFLKHVPADVKAAIFWLTNRRPSEWSNKGGSSKPVQKSDFEQLHRELIELRSGKK